MSFTTFYAIRKPAVAGLCALPILNLYCGGVFFHGEGRGLSHPSQNNLKHPGMINISEILICKAAGACRLHPEHITTGRPSTSFRYATPIARPSHIGGESAPIDMLPIVIG